MILLILLLIPILGIFIILTGMFNVATTSGNSNSSVYELSSSNLLNSKRTKVTALTVSIVNLVISLILFIFFDFSSNQFQFVQEYHEISHFHIYLGVDGLSIYFVLLTTIITPIALLSNWTSISENVKSYVVIILLLESLLLAVFLVLDILLFYIFFESILPPLFLLIGLFGSSNKVRASFYLFLYTFFLKCKRAKHRGSPKTLVTKVIKEILSLAWLMPQGMVKSLVFIYEKHLKSLGVDKWVIAVLNHLKNIRANHSNKPKIVSLEYKDVKEQRVDGSSKSSYVGDFVRCTLVAGKPVFGRKIHYHSDSGQSPINSKNFSNVVFIRSIHSKIKNIEFASISENKIYEGLSSKNPSSVLTQDQNQTNLDPWFITGLADAEGCFTIGFFRNEKYKMGYQVVAIFKIALHKKDLNLLSQIRDYFGEGSITKHGETTIQYTIKSLHYLNMVISHFDKYPLQTEKATDFNLFKQAILLIRNKEHLNREGFFKLLSIKSSINLGLSDELKLSFPEIKAVSRPSNLKVVALSNISCYWFAGLASGDGCFHISIRHCQTTRTGKSVILKFQIVQHSKDTELMRKLVSHLACGRIELALKQSAVYFVVTNFNDIIEKIIPLFDKYPIKGVKALDYETFKKVAYIMHEKQHLTEQGLSKILSLKLTMNSFREK